MRERERERKILIERKERMRQIDGDRKIENAAILEGSEKMDISTRLY